MHAGASSNVLAVFWWAKTKKTSSQSLLVARTKDREGNSDNKQEKDEMEDASNPWYQHRLGGEQIKGSPAEKNLGWLVGETLGMS